MLGVGPEMAEKWGSYGFDTFEVEGVHICGQVLNGRKVGCVLDLFQFEVKGVNCWRWVLNGRKLGGYWIYSDLK